MRLILIRHGRTEANERHLYCGSTDIGLSADGRAGLEDLKDCAVYPDVSGMRILTSGMKRCAETLAVLFGELPYGTEPDFREMDFGVFEMRSYEEMKEDPEYLEWIGGDNEANTAPGGESGKQMTERVIRGLMRLEEEGKDVLLVTHGGVIAAVMAYLFPEENKNRYEWQPSCGCGYAVDTVEREYLPVPSFQATGKEV